MWLLCKLTSHKTPLYNERNIWCYQALRPWSFQSFACKPYNTQKHSPPLTTKSIQTVVIIWNLKVLACFLAFRAERGVRRKRGKKNRGLWVSVLYYMLPGTCYLKVRVVVDVVQGHPTTVFCKISVRRSKYCLEFFITWRTAKNFLMTVPFMYNFRSLSNKFPTISVV